MSTQSEIKPVTFLNRQGLKLFGMLHIPYQARKDVGIVILSPGIKNRVAPHRLYIKMARRFSELGFQVFRFDPEGLGDSEGKIDEQFTADLYGSIQVGRFIEDTFCAMDYMEKECQVPRFILSGLCGGAITGLHAGAKDKRVDSLLGLGIPVILDGSSIDRRKYLTEGEWVHTRRKYIRKVLDPRAWWRFISFKSDYLLLLNSIFQPFSKKGQTSYVDPTEARGTKNKQQNLDQNNFNPYFPKIFKKFSSSGKMFLIFSGADRLFWEFEEKYWNKYREDLELSQKQFRMDIVKDANHIFSFREWQEDMLARCCEWLKEEY